MAQSPLPSPFIQGEEFKSPNFTGRVWLHFLVKPGEGFNPIANVTFEPGCRNSWHKHPGGQILVCVTGQGYYQEKGKPIQLLNPGDCVKIPINVEHWHGATPGSWFSHIAIEGDEKAGPAEWLQPVTDIEYNSYKPPECQINYTDDAKRNLEEMFPNLKSPFSDTDPDIIEIFDNFSFGDVPQYGHIDKKTRVMLILASAITQHTAELYRRMLEGALNLGVTPIEIKEILYHCVPYVGWAKVVDFIPITNSVLSGRGIKLPLPTQSTTTHDNRFEKGLEAQKSIFGDVIDNNYKNSPENQVHIQKYLSANCFGDYYTRSGVDVKMRELITFSIILSLGGCEPQLKGHISGNVNVGNDKLTLLGVVTGLLPYIGYPRSLNAIRCINEVIPESK